MRITVLGAGAWGTAMGIRLTSRATVRLWTRSQEHAEAMHASRTNARYLPGQVLPTGLSPSSDLDWALDGADWLISAVPSSAFRPLLQTLRERGVKTPLIWLCKGFEAATRRLPHEVLEEVWPEHPPAGILSGPSFALEVARGLPAALTLASANTLFARHAAQALHDPRLRLYASSDVVGVELGGAVKNVIAIATGISDGLGFGLNARAALVTRGLAELTRLGLHLGGRPETFMGLSGMGDLILTCTGDLSRNRQLGLRLAAGDNLAVALRGLGHVAEGATTALELAGLAETSRIDMPIAQAVASILRGVTPPREAVAALMARELRDEGT